MCAKSLQSCPTLGHPVDCSLLGPSVHGISQTRYWSGLLFPPPGDLPHPGMEPWSLKSPAWADWFFITNATWKTFIVYVFKSKRVNLGICFRRAKPGRVNLIEKLQFIRTDQFYGQIHARAGFLRHPTPRFPPRWGDLSS